MNQIGQIFYYIINTLYTILFFYKFIYLFHFEKNQALQYKNFKQYQNLFKIKIRN